MTNHELLTDDFVAELLDKEAQDCSAKYSAVGLEAYRSSKPANKAKPNTRFLRNIIRETDSHNKALLAKEAAESQARLDDLTKAEQKKRLKTNPGAGDIRKRQLGDISAILAGRKRKHSSSAGDSSSKPERDSNTPRSSREEDDRPRKRADRDEEQERERSERHRSHRHRSHRHEGSESGDEQQSRRHKHRKERHRSRTPEDRDRKKRRHRSRSPLHRSGRESSAESDSPRASRRHKRDLMDSQRSSRDEGRLRREDDADRPSRRDRDARNRDRRHSRHDRTDNVAGGRSTRDEPEDKDIDSDPLNDIIGPMPPPPVRKRGRGSASGASAMDKRFSDSYDPSSDLYVEMDEAEAWDDAVEAFRDRAKWKKQGAERLRAAGFTDEEVKKWEKGDEKNEDDVRWRKQGEKREWDRGKELGIDGMVRSSPAWP